MKLTRSLYFISCLFVFGTCTSALEPPTTREQQSVDAAGRSRGSSSTSPSSAKNSDLDKLAKLWQERQHEKSVTDYPIGAGDVLEISVPAIEELKGRTVRVSGDGTIALPFLGKMHAAGMTEEQLRGKMVEVLHKYMHNPRVAIFVKEYRSRQVAVLGAVFKPGLYSMNTGADTILDMISHAGGITSGADPRLYFIPAVAGDESQMQQIASTLPKSLLEQDPTPLILKRTDPILIDLKDLALGGHQQYLSLSVRPGDIIMVPGGGQILVEGWVEKPGAYNVTPGLTASGAVVAAGGLLYPADDTAVKVIRSERNGKRNVTMADITKIKSGESPDVTLQGGDIVEVTATTSRLIPYGLYRFFTTIVNVGVGGSIPLTGGS
jgi:polysaccharide export outer membrane protein